MHVKSQTGKVIHKEILVPISGIRYFDHRNKIHRGFLERYHRQSLEQRMGLSLEKLSYPVAFHGRILHLCQSIKQPMEGTVWIVSIHIQTVHLLNRRDNDNSLDKNGIMMDYFKGNI